MKSHITIARSKNLYFQIDKSSFSIEISPFTEIKKMWYNNSYIFLLSKRLKVPLLANDCTLF